MQSLNTFDLNLLRVFDAMIREHSVQGAADRIGLSPPAVSNALNRLRAALGDPLFVRTRHGMEPTPFASSLNEPIQNALSNIRAALACNADFDPSGSMRSFSFLMNDTGAVSFLPQVIQRLGTEAPHIKLVVHERDHADYEDALDSGFADVAVGRVKLSRSFQSELIFTDQHVAIMRHDHPALRRGDDGAKFLAMGDYLAAPHIDVAPRGVTSNTPEKVLAPNHRRRVAVSVPQMAAVARIVPRTDLIATVPSMCVNFLCNTGELDWVALPFKMEIDRMYLWWHNRENSDPGHRWFRAVVREELTAWVKAPLLSRQPGAGMAYK